MQLNRFLGIRKFCFTSQELCISFNKISNIHIAAEKAYVLMMSPWYETTKNLNKVYSDEKIKSRFIIDLKYLFTIIDLCNSNKIVLSKAKSSLLTSPL